jgi:hypothetical protein
MHRIASSVPLSSSSKSPYNDIVIQLCLWIFPLRLDDIDKLGNGPVFTDEYIDELVNVLLFNRLWLLKLVQPLDAPFSNRLFGFWRMGEQVSPVRFPRVVIGLLGLRFRYSQTDD